MLTGRRIDPSVIQRRLREVGRIRTGYSDEVEGKTWRKPRRSDTLILSSVQQRLIVAAAALWGGEPEEWTPQGSSVPVWRVVTDQKEIPAILPQGNPLSTMFEMWVGGRCHRRCDGLWEDKDRVRKPCVCAANFGDLWHEQEPTNPPTICKPTARLNVYLEGLGDFGWWRAEVHSYHAVAELEGIVDLIKGRLGPEPSVRIRLAIEWRTVPKRKFPVLSIRMDDENAIMILSGQAPRLMVEGLPDRAALTSGPADAPPPAEERPALTAAPTPTPAPQTAGETLPRDWEAEFGAATSREELATLWRQAGAGRMSDQLKAVWKASVARVDSLTTQPPPAGPAATVDTPAARSEPVDAEVIPDRLALWMSILQVANEMGWDEPTISEKMRKQTPYTPETADAAAMDFFLAALQAGKIT